MHSFYVFLSSLFADIHMFCMYRPTFSCSYLFIFSIVYCPSFLMMSKGGKIVVAVQLKMHGNYAIV